MDLYAYKVADSAREKLVPNLRLAAQVPFRGITAYIAEEPHLIIDKVGDNYIMEDQFGHQKKVDFVFPWDEATDSNRLIAASRLDISPFKFAGLLFFDQENSQWHVRVGTSSTVFPLEEKIAELEAAGWSKEALGDNGSGLDLGGHNPSSAGPAHIDHPGGGHGEPTIEVRAGCPHCHSDQHLEALGDDEDERHSGKEKMFACHNCGKWSFEHELEVSDHDKDGQDKNPEDVDYDEHDDDAKRHQEPEEEKEVHDDDDKHEDHGEVSKDEENEFFKKKKHSADEQGGFHFQGYPAAATHTVEGIAIDLDKESPDQAQARVQQLTSPQEDQNSFIDQKNKEFGTSFPNADNPFINRGGSRTAAPELLRDRLKGLDTRHLPENWQSIVGDEPYSPNRNRLPNPADSGQKYPQHFNYSGKYILVKRFVSQEDIHWILTDKCVGIITSEGGPLSHVQVVAKEAGLVSIIAPDSDLARIQPGDSIVIEGQTGGVSINGVKGVYQRPNSFTDVIADEPIYRFVWANGHGYSEKMTGGMTGDKGGHGGMLMMLADEGLVDWANPVNLTLGFFCSNGKIIQDSNNTHIDEQKFLTWAHQEESNVGLPAGSVIYKDVSQMVAPGAAASEPQQQQPDQQQQLQLAKTAATFEMPYPGGQGIHNGTSGAFTQAGLTATVNTPAGLPQPITLPFSAGNMFIMIKMFQAQGLLKPGETIIVDSENPELAKQLIDQQSGATAKVAYEDALNLDEGGTQHGQDKLDDAITCPHCGSHTVETLSHDEDTGDAEWLCLTCDNTFNAKYRKHAGAEHAKGTRVELIHPSKKGIKGSITDHCGIDENFGDHTYDLILDNGDEMKKVPEVHFKKIKSASVENYSFVIEDEEGNVLHSSVVRRADYMPPVQDPAAAQAGGQTTPPCPHCGSQTTGTPNYYWCPQCGWKSNTALTNEPNVQPVNQSVGPPVPTNTYHSHIKSAALTPGEWYTMFSPNYKVPDVIQVTEVNEHGITANIEGDDKGLFPIELPHEQIEKEGYKFEPYLSTAIEKIARRTYTVNEQQDLVNENLEGTARNIHKLNLEGTHYNTTEAKNTNPLQDEFWLW